MKDRGRTKERSKREKEGGGSVLISQPGLNVTDLGRFKTRSLGLPSGTSGPGGGCEDSTGGTADLLLSFFDSFLPDLSFFSGLSGLSGLSGFAGDCFTPGSSLLVLLGLSPFVFAVEGEVE